LNILSSLVAVAVAVVTAVAVVEPVVFVRLLVLRLRQAPLLPLLLAVAAQTEPAEVTLFSVP
jgi:hypothetical protein